MTLHLRLLIMYRDLLDCTNLIMGEVLPITSEYEEGLRFFDNCGIMYRADGTLSGTPSPLDLVRLATPEECDGFTMPACVNLDIIKDQPDLYVPVGHPTFEIKHRGHYVNRMGFLLTYDALTYKYDITGRRFTHGLSMEDILYYCPV